MRIDITWLAGATALFALPLAPQEPRAFEDPRPPEVNELEAVEAPEPATYPELRFHRAPKPLAEGAVTEDWPTFLGPRRDAHSRETKLLREWPAGGPALVWEMDCGQGFAAPVVAGGRVVFTHRVGNTAVVDCLAAETGKRTWRFSYPCHYRGTYVSDGGPRAAPVIVGERVYVHGVEGMLHCLELATGRVVWKRDTRKDFGVGDDFFGVVSSPLAHGGLLIQNIGAPTGPSVAAFDLRDGHMVWGAGDEWGPSCASPVVAELGGRERLFVLAGGESRPPTGGLMVMEPAQGALEFTYPFRSRTFTSVLGASPVVGDERVFITASYNTGTAGLGLDDDGRLEELWKTRHLGMQFSNPVYEDGHLYAVDGVSGRSGAIVCLAPETGKELARTDLVWDETFDDGGKERTLSMTVGEGSLLRVDGSFLCLGDFGHLLWLDASPAGARVLQRAWLFRAQESWTPPVVSGGLLYVRQTRPERFGDAPRRLLCFDLRGS